jgi:hypothetical protein
MARRMHGLSLMRVPLGIGLVVLAGLLHVHAVAVDRVQEFPFQFREGMLWVQVQATGAAKPLNFLLDSGAGASVLDLRTAQALGIKLARRVRVRGVGASTTGYWPEHLRARAGEVLLPSNYLAVDLTALSQACKCPVDGLIGADFFRDQVVQIDFAHQKVRLLPLSAPGQGQQVVPLETSAGALRVPVRINQGSPQWLRLDTGCASSLQWVTSALPATVPQHQLAVALTGVSFPVVSTRVQLGGFCFPAVPTGLHKQPLFAGESGLLGNGLLSQFASVTLDAKAGRMVLQKL